MWGCAVRSVTTSTREVGLLTAEGASDGRVEVVSPCCDLAAGDFEDTMIGTDISTPSLRRSTSVRSWSATPLSLICRCTMKSMPSSVAKNSAMNSLMASRLLTGTQDEQDGGIDGEDVRP